ncbi:hypothetical protein MIR68_007546 [Amoeboaphelidium protococcarum]|nr:hypothetical protein MIR68_007546 [Amoeboaphelidium protococcarum]
MPVCVQCGNSVSSLYTEYSKGNIKLTRCTHGNNVADMYIEHGFTLLFIDLLLHKKNVYRHILFNRLQYVEHGLGMPVIRILILQLLFDVYVRTLRNGNLQSSDSLTSQADAISFYASNYAQLLLRSALDVLLYHVVVRGLVLLTLPARYAIVKFNYISIALIISSFPKLLLLPMVIWDYQKSFGHMFGWEWFYMVDLLVFTSNTEALSVFLDTSYLTAMFYTSVGFLINSLSGQLLKSFDLFT